MFDLSLYLVTDSRLSLGRSNADVVRAAVQGGVSCVQFRDKHLDDETFLAEAIALHQILHSLDLPLIINDRVEIAREIDADGLHLGQSDMPLRKARRIVGPDTLIGISAESVDDAIRAEEQGADYIGISPVFATGTKTDTAQPLGLAGIAAIRKKTTIPLVGIGGISEINAAEVILAGADGIAVVSAIVSQPSPQQASKTLLQTIQQARNL